MPNPRSDFSALTACRRSYQASPLRLTLENCLSSVAAIFPSPSLSTFHIALGQPEALIMDFYAAAPNCTRRRQLEALDHQKKRSASARSPHRLLRQILDSLLFRAPRLQPQFPPSNTPSAVPPDDPASISLLPIFFVSYVPEPLLLILNLLIIWPEPVRRAQTKFALCPPSIPHSISPLPPAGMGRATQIPPPVFVFFIPGTFSFSVPSIRCLGRIQPFFVYRPRTIASATLGRSSLFCLSPLPSSPPFPSPFYLYPIIPLHILPSP